MPKLQVLKSRRIKDIPTQNPYNYAGQVVPIYEIHRVLRSEMVELSCRSTHCIKARSTNVHKMITYMNCSENSPTKTSNSCGSG